MLRLHNSLTRELEPFEPLDPPRVGVYACGPTVYDVAHIGNFRFNVWVDVFRRILEWRGHDVTLVMNITDVDDKTIDGAGRAGESLAEYTGRYTEEFFRDLDALGIRRADHYPRATGHIDEMIGLVERLLDRGLAYRSGGSVYFRVGAFEDYGRLSHLDPDRLEATGRAADETGDKEDPRDFVLWKRTGEDEPTWDAPFGPGRPGWHLECSAMSMAYLGETFDVHLGGVDLMFPHHENEIAQSVGATGRTFVRTWLHCAHLIVDGVKMSKSLGNQYTLRDLTDRGADPLSVRWLLASVHYRKQLNFTFEALDQAASAIARLREVVLRLEQESDDLPDDVADDRVEPALEGARKGFVEALEDDVNTSGALGHLFTLVRAVHAGLDGGTVGGETARRALAWIRDVDAIWNVLPDPEERVELEVEVDGHTLQAVGPRLPDDQLDMVVDRMKARAERDFVTADELRERLAEAGVEVEDTGQGARWRLLG